MSRLHCAAASAFIVAGIVDVTGTQAASLRVGDAVQIVHDVESQQSGDHSWGAKAVGEGVYENESIRTEVESQASIVLVDRTGLSVGPITKIRIDRMLYNSDQSIKTVIVSADAGTLRWISGDSKTHLVTTPTATVTPTGTMFDLFVDSRRTFVILRQGSVRVCTRNQRQTCKTLDKPGDMILATADELQGPGRGGLEQAEFANRCLSATGQDCVMKMTESPPHAPQREPPASKTRRADNVQPSRSRVDDEYVPPRRRMTYPTDYRRPYDYRRSYARYSPAGTGYIVPYPRKVMYRPTFRPMYGRHMYGRPMYGRPMYGRPTYGRMLGRVY
jgi:Tfp pilus assembly protein FimT